MADITITTHAQFIPELWGTMVLEPYRKHLVLAPLMDHKYEKLLTNAGYGDTVNVPDFTGPVIGDVQTLTNMTGTITEAAAVTEAQNQIVVNTRNAMNQPVDDIAKLQSRPDLMALFTDRMGYLMAEKLDSNLAGDNSNGLDSFTQVVGTDAIDVTDPNILRCMQYLDDANALPTERFLVVSPATLMSLYGIEKFMNSLYASSAGNLRGNKGYGHVGSIYDLEVYKTTNLEAGASGTKNAVFQREAIALIQQEDVTVDLRKPVNAIKVHILAWNAYGFKKLRNTAGVELDGK